MVLFFTTLHACVRTHMCLCLYFKVALENHSCSKFLNTGKPAFGLNGGELVKVHVLVLAQGPFEAFGSNELLLANWIFLLLTECPF